jgi:predicted RNA-binding Zn-ribbon protein involved in translation (DUF1610 family)
MGSSSSFLGVNDSAVDEQDLQSTSFRQSGSALTCPTCGKQMLKRTSRKGFMQRVVFVRFGYYPWKCGSCRSVRLLKNRGMRTRRKSED